MNNLLEVAAVITAIGVLLVALKKVFIFTKKTIYLVDEVVGDEDNGHVGVIKRVTVIEGELTTVKEWAERHDEECKHTNKGRRY